MIGLGCWALVRLATRSPRGVYLIADYTWAALVAHVSPVVANAASIGASTSPTFAVVTIVVATVAIEMPARLSIPLSVALIGLYTCRGADPGDWRRLLSCPEIYDLIASVALALLIRWAIGRMAAAIDAAHQDRVDAEIASSVATWRLAFEREQLAVLHDTAAATLLLASEVDSPPRDKLAAQAARDLEILQRPLDRAVPRVEIVDMLRDAVRHAATPTLLVGLPELWLDGRLACAVEAAVREALNNVDRHARARQAVIEVTSTAVTVRDDGAGADPAKWTPGYGVAESIVGRMNRAGGLGSIDSVPGRGTTVQLSWHPETQAALFGETIDESERLIRRIRVICGLILTAYGLSSVLTMAPWGIASGVHPATQAVLAVVTAVCAAAALPGLIAGHWGPARGAVVILALVALCQPLLLSDAMLRTEAQWTVAAVGFAMVPLLINVPLPRSVSVVLLWWLVPAAVDFIRVPSTLLLAAIVTGAASFLVPQIGLAVFNAVAQRVARKAHGENVSRDRLVVEHAVAEALRVDYEARYAATTQRLLPVLEELAREGPITDELRRRAGMENLRLRQMFDEARGGTQSRLEPLRAVINAAAERGVDVTTRIDPRAGDLSEADAGRLVDAIGAALADARSYARVVVTAAGATLTGSVVADGTCPDRDRQRFRDDVEVLDSSGSRWVTCRVPITTPRS
ncbi:hypothetical protein [Mycobacterium sp. DL592]|uniref:ATP-binding protein n=1 Tax=Mycobacterium sp. DL592 TaxID=2675524 RepID=UPI001AAFB143|nr:hypothetical protein [Mycobacterium sp. DL592]